MGCKIGIISDIHFGKFSRTNELAVPGEDIQDNTTGAAPLLQGASDIFKQQSVKYLFIAGDLTSVASPQEYYYCEKKIVEFAKSSGIQTEDIIICTGNHDVDRKIANLANECKNDDAQVKQIVTEKYQRIAAATSSHILTDMEKPKNGIVPFSGIVAKEHFIVFVLNTGLYCSTQQQISHGKLGIDQLNWLKGSLENYRQDSRTKIVLMHHHPIAYSYPFPIWDSSRVEEDSDLKKIIGNEDVSIVIHGHRHHPRVTTTIESDWKHAVTFLCAGSFSVNARHRADGEIPNTLHILELGDQREKYLLYNYQYKGGPGWEAAQYDDSNMPLDHLMQIGKFITDETAIDLIKKYENRESKITWDSLDDELKYCSTKRLNELFKSVMKPKYSVIGEFPKDIVLILDKDN